MSGIKLQMKLHTNQSIQLQQQQIQTKNQTSMVKQFQTTNVKLGFNSIKNNYAALKFQGKKYCKSCNDKK
tara:strand:- start:287 stop:496 length:210 start_codon:yes stop_codon:yes gene_type:complete